MKTISTVFTINKDNEIVAREDFGRCTRCGEMTSLQSPCCVSVALEIEGDLVLPSVDEDEIDPTPYCAWCNSKTRKGCHCPPRAAND